MAKTTSFNGAKLLDGSFTGAVFQVGANSGDNITVGALANTKVDQLGKTTYAAVSHASITETQKNAAGAALTSAAATITITGANGVAVTATVAKGDSVTGDEALGRALQAINSKTSDTGVVAFLSSDGKSIEYRASVKDGETAASVAVGSAQGDFQALISGTGAEKKVTGIADVDIGTQAGAWEALQQIDKAIDKVNTARGELGAIQTRFEKTVENIDIQNENLTAARGRVVDADFAQETANLSRTQILQQAGTAMVAQANQLPQQVLSLLR